MREGMEQEEGEEVRSRGGNHLSTIRKSTNASKCAHKFQNEKTDAADVADTASGWAAAAATVADAASAVSNPVSRQGGRGWGAWLSTNCSCSALNRFT